MRLSIIIVNYNSPKCLEQCLASINHNLKAIVDKEVIVVDNASAEENLDELTQRYSFLSVIRLTSNVGFGAANNIGVAKACGNSLLLLNSDTELVDTSLSEMLSAFEQTNGAELWSCKLLWPDGRFQNGFSGEIGFLEFLGHYSSFSPVGRLLRLIDMSHKMHGQCPNKVMEVPIVYGTAMLLRKADFLRLSGFNEKYFLYYEDIDLCERFRKEIHGHIRIYPDCAITHHVQGSQPGKYKRSKFHEASRYAYGLQKFGHGRMLVFASVNWAFAWVSRVNDWLSPSFKQKLKKHNFFNL